jgi:hypothetical protein
LTPLGRERLNFEVAQRYDLLSPDVPDLLSSAKNFFFFSGISLRGWINNEGFLSQLKDRAQSKRCELTGDVMRSRTRFHADQAAWNVGEPALKLRARALQLQNDRSALIKTDKMKAILAEIDADRAHGGGCCGFV